MDMAIEGGTMAGGGGGADTSVRGMGSTQGTMEEHFSYIVGVWVVPCQRDGALCIISVWSELKPGGILDTGELIP